MAVPLAMMAQIALAALQDPQQLAQLAATKGLEAPTGAAQAQAQTQGGGVGGGLGALVPPAVGAPMGATVPGTLPQAPAPGGAGGVGGTAGSILQALTALKPPDAPNLSFPAAVAPRGGRPINADLLRALLSQTGAPAGAVPSLGQLIAGG